MTDDTANARINDHIAECSRWRETVASRMDGMDTKLDTLLMQAALVQGRSQVTRSLLGAIPNAFWAVVIAGGGSTLTVAAMHFLEKWK